MRTLYGFIAAFGALVLLLIVVSRSGEAEELEIVSTSDDKLVLRWEGPVEPPMARTLASALRAKGTGAQHVRLELHSPGGLVAEGERVIRVLRQAGTDLPLETHVRAGDTCASMCIPIYLAGERRTAGADALFMFHDSYAADPITGAALPSGGRDRQYAMINFREQFADADINQTWVADLRREIDREGEVWRTARNLYDEQSGIVTRFPR